MNFVSQSFVELARNSRLFAGVVAADTPLSYHELANHAYGYFKVSPADISEAMTATLWTTGVEWKEILKGTPAETAVVNATRQVFICMVSPGTPSTVEPVRIEASDVATSDGYVWRYLFTVSEAQHVKFSWSDKVPLGVMPAPYVTTFDVSALPSTEFDTPSLRFYPERPHTPTARVINHQLTAILAPAGVVAASDRQYVVVEPSGSQAFGAKVNAAIAAGVITPAVVSEGQGYDALTVVTVFGDGVGAEAEAVVSAGKVVAVNMTSQGTGYTWADIIVSNGVGSGVAPAIVVDYDVDLDRGHTLISKTVPIIDPSSEVVLDTHYFISRNSEPNSRIRGKMGSLLIGVDPTTTFHLLDECKRSSFMLSQEMLINTHITSG